jgi:MoaE-MoaD fusion protein
MRIRVLAFASAGDALGRESLELELPAGSRVAELRARLEQDHPRLGPLWERLAIAVEGEIATPTTPLAEGVEVALLPPVSGGSATEAAPALAVALTEAPLDPAALAAAVTSPRRGALVLFSGTVRNHHQGREVAAITYSAYGPMAQARLERIARELEATGQDLAVAIHHRLGRLEPGEASVLIATASPHREEAYQASRKALERLKAEVPIWKREHYADGSAAWREEERL